MRRMLKRILILLGLRRKLHPVSVDPAVLSIYSRMENIRMEIFADKLNKEGRRARLSGAGFYIWINLTER